MTTNEKIARIRQLMARDQVQAVIIPSGDPHMSEYFSEHWKTRRFVSGFTGSVGTYVITENASGLWVDGRYYVQAEKQIADSEAVLFRASEPDCPTFSQYLLDNLAPNSVVGLNGKLFSLSMMEQMQQLFAQKGITLNIQAGTQSAETADATSQTASLSASTIITVPCGTTGSIALSNTSAGSVNLTNANIRIVRVL